MNEDGEQGRLLAGDLALRTKGSKGRRRGSQRMQELDSRFALTGPARAGKADDLSVSGNMKNGIRFKDIPNLFVFIPTPPLVI